MTDKQFKSLRRAIIGAALFIGGAILYSVSWWRTVFLLAGIIIMFSEELQLHRFIEWFAAPPKTENEKEDNENESN